MIKNKSETKLVNLLSCDSIESITPNNISLLETILLVKYTVLYTINIELVNQKVEIIESKSKFNQFQGQFYQQLLYIKYKFNYTITVEGLVTEVKALN